MEKNVAEKKQEKTRKEKREKKKKENVQFWCGSLDAFLHSA